MLIHFGMNPRYPDTFLGCIYNDLPGHISGFFCYLQARAASAESSRPLFNVSWPKTCFRKLMIYWLEPSKSQKKTNLNSKPDFRRLQDNTVTFLQLWRKLISRFVTWSHLYLETGSKNHNVWLLVVGLSLLPLDPLLLLKSALSARRRNTYSSDNQ